ncbi:O-antigen ligase family protein [Thermomonas mangrovi]|uniref:O-antigen ligase family protein n=1 Tax=Thermomonas mangrovi TaxID=2993316 RepID=UPI0023073289|nr:hypothetical protein [Thermomonas mangrovi]
MANVPLNRLLALAVMALLLVLWLGGGVTRDSTSADEILELLSLPVIALAAWVLAGQGVRDRLQWAGLLALALVALVPALQLLPWPDGSSAIAWRRQLLGDLAFAGVDDPRLRWSLVPAATERGLWALLPAVAVFLSAIALDSMHRRWLVKWILLLVGFNVAFAFFQAGLPLDSPWRLYHGFDPRFGGLFANTNHHATALVIGMVLALGQAIHARRRDLAGRGRPGAWLWYAGFAASCLLLLPLTTSRAGIALALPALAATWIACGGLGARGLRSPRLLVGTAAAGILAIVGIRAGSGWLEVDRVHELRDIIAGTTWTLGNAQAPLGSGIGSFVQVFEQGAPRRLWLDAYVNHAHNEYAQWWLEAGWAGMLALAVAVAVLGAAAWRVVRARGRDGDALLAGSCLVAIVAVLAHSWADYPLRTLALMATTAALAGAMLGALADLQARRMQAPQRLARHPEGRARPA